MHALKLVRIDDSIGLILPKEAVAKLKRGAGDTVFLTETPEGLLLCVHNPAIQTQLAAGREFVRDFHHTLRLLSE